MFLTALGTVEYLKLKEEDIVFLYTRNYKSTIIPISFTQIDFSDIFADSMKRGEEFFFWKLNKLIDQVDKRISSVVPNEYIAYLPHVGVFLPQVIATNLHCTGIRLIEEGIGCYSLSIGERTSSLREITKRFLSFIVNQYRRYWFTDQPFYHKFLLKRLLYETETFGLSLDTYKSLSYKKNIIKWPNIKTNVNLDKSFPIFIFEAAIEQKFVSEPKYFSSVKIMIDQASQATNYVKYHPFQSENNKQTIRGYFKAKNVELIELPTDTPFELILLQFKNLNVFGFGSSLLLYAKNLGHQVQLFEYLLIDDPLYFRYKQLVDYKI
ncbi:hypothetical protein GCM10027035_41150 [Emticicia sediminis]